MEPRPQKPNRSTGPFISTNTPTPAQSSSSGGFGQPAFDASAAPPAPPPPIGYDPDYSPGQPLTPLRGPRGANIVGPLLAVAALAIIVAAVAFIVSQFRENGGNDDNPTAVSAVVNTPADDNQTTDSGSAADKTQTAEDGESSSGNDQDAAATKTPKVSRPTADPNESLDATEPPADDAASGDEPKAKTKASQWFPKESTVGEGFVRSDNGTRTMDDVVASFPEAVQIDAPAKLDEMGWVENAYRQFTNDSAAADQTSVVNVSVHRFKTENGASEALQYFADGGATAQGLTAVEGASEIGDESITLQGTIEGGNVYVVYFRIDRFVFRIGGLSTTGDPSETTISVAQAIADQ
jgi:hypothetical protein